jgi:hypothetical protein
LARLLHADGEDYYDAVQYEMTLWALLVVGSLVVVIERARHKRRK